MGITFEQVSYSYKERALKEQLALDHIDFSLGANQFITIVGAPGSGKSTLLQHLNGLLRADHGSIHLLDMDIPAHPAKLPKQLRQRVGLVFQYPEQQLFQQTIWKDLLYGPLNFEASAAEAELAARSAAEAMGLDEALLAKTPYQLSSGQMRKAAIASVLAAKPDIIVLDEPTASLDALSRSELMQLLHRQCQEQQRTVIVVTHSLEEVLPYTNQMMVMHKGKILFSGEPYALMRRTDVLDAAGLQIPAAYQLYFALKEPLELSELHPYPDASRLAAAIKQALQGIS